MSDADAPSTPAEPFDAVIVGAGFSGLYMLHRLRQAGMRAILFEAAGGVGGTWYWNRYPGARVDIESMEYCYSFSDELTQAWRWSERYAAQPELLAYLDHVADRFGLRRDIRLETRVTAARFDEATRLWRVTTDRGVSVAARFCIMATGCLSVPKAPDIPGLDAFAGPSYFTSRWPHQGVDFTGLRVGVIGTGSSAIQSIPEIARQSRQVTVFQRTPNYSVPAHNAPADEAVAAEWRANRAFYRQQARDSGFGILMVSPNDRSALEAGPTERTEAFEARWAVGGFSLMGAFNDLTASQEANDTAAEFVAAKIRAIVKDPATAAKLTPRTYPLGAKRLCVDTGYYATFNRDNVGLVDLTEEPIESVTAAGVRTAKADYAFDAMVYAIGFDAMTGALAAIDIVGRGGARLSDAWVGGPRTYLGLTVAGFPNLFLVTGPGSPSVLANMAVAIEQHVEWIADCIAWMGARQLGVIEAETVAQDAWVDHVNAVAETTLFPRANSWYLGANVPGKPRVFMPYIGGFKDYRERCEAVAANAYEGFAMSAAAS